MLFSVSEESVLVQPYHEGLNDLVVWSGLSQISEVTSRALDLLARTSGDSDLARQLSVRPRCFLVVEWQTNRYLHMTLNPLLA